MAGAQYNIDIGNLSAYLARNIPGFGTLRAMEKFGGGQSNPTYRLICDDAQFVLRAKPTGDLVKSAHQVDREYRVMAALAETGVPVARVFHLSEDDSPLGVMFFVMELVAGRIFWDPALPDLTSGERGQVYGQIATVLAALHDVDPIAVGLGDFGAPGNYFERQLSRWSRQYLGAEARPDNDIRWIIDWLSEHQVEDDGQRSIVHGDYRIDNLIFASDGTKLIAVLDWELSTLGHPMADVAYQAMQWRQPKGSQLRGLGDIDRQAMGIPTEASYLAAYCAKRGIEPPANWEFYLTFSYFRLIAILSGVVRRAADGNASNPAGVEGFRRAIPILTAQARAIAGAVSG